MEVGYEIEVPNRALPEVYRQLCSSYIDHMDEPILH